MMSMVGRLVGAVSENVSALFDVQVHRWVPFPSAALRLRTKLGGEGNERRVTLLVWHDSPTAALSRFEPVTSGRLRLGATQKEHVARRALVHPSAVMIEPGGALVADAGRPTLDLSAVRAYWSNCFGVGELPVEDLDCGRAARLVGDVVLSDPTAFARVQGSSCMDLANHKIGAASLLFSLLISARSKTPTNRGVAHPHWQQHRGCRDVCDPRRSAKSRCCGQGRCPFALAWRAGKTPIWPQRTARRRSQVVTI